MKTYESKKLFKLNKLKNAKFLRDKKINLI